MSRTRFDVAVRPGAVGRRASAGAVVTASTLANGSERRLNGSAGAAAAGVVRRGDDLR
jgi:hypothetical protein